MCAVFRRFDGVNGSNGFSGVNGQSNFCVVFDDVQNIFAIFAGILLEMEFSCQSVFKI